MVLHPLEFSECHLDSPWFRKSVQQYEEELERTNAQIKQLIKDANRMLSNSRAQAKSMTTFNETLRRFQFDIIGENLTDDERGIAGSLNEFGLMLDEVAEQWSDTIDRSEIQLIKPLEMFRKNQIHSYKESKKAFDKSSEKYYKQLEHTLSLSHKKKEQQLIDSDLDLSNLKRQFHKDALNYVYKLQEIQERKKFEFVEHLLMFMKVYFNFFKQSHETALDCREYMTDLQMRLISTRERYEGTREKTQSLMRKMEENPQGGGLDGTGVNESRWSRAGYLFMLDKNTISARLTSKWTRYFCTYNKDNKLFQIISSYHSGPGFNNTNTTSSPTNLEPMIVKTCTRRSTDSIDKRFCFDLEVEDTGGKVQLLTFQAVSDGDRKKWMQVMDGKEPEYQQAKDFLKKEGRFKLDETGFKFVERVIAEIEKRGVEHEGIYRLVGVMSKVDLLLQQGVNENIADSVDYSNQSEWEINTLTSALKSAFRNLPDPIMTFDLHRDFINAAKCEDPAERVTRVANLVNKLPPENKKVLAMLARHLRKVEARSGDNKMTIQNLGVCFGPTLMRDRQETVQSIMELKFSNIIVEILIEEYGSVFEDDDAAGDHKRSPQPARDKSPRSAARNSTVHRLPSQRIRSRPKAVYELTSMPNILEQGDDDTKKPKNFRRTHAFRTGAGRSPSPRNTRDLLQPNHVIGDQWSTDEDELHISPLDLNLGFDQFKPSANHSYINVAPSVPPPPVPAHHAASKERWTPNGKAEISSDANSSNSQASDAGSTTASKAAPVPKKRLSSRSGRSREPVYAQVNKNQNNNNNSQHTLSPPPKPKSLAVSASIVQRSKKFLASVKEGSSPTVPVKYARKMLQSPSKTKGKSIRRSAPAAKSPSLVLRNKNKDNEGKSPVPRRRPRSEFIPPIFQVEEKDLNPAEREAASPSEPETSGRHQDQDDGIRPRSSAVLTSRESVGRIIVQSASDDSDESSTYDVTPDGEAVVTSQARTLYVCQAEHDGELSFQPDQLITNVVESEEPGWLRGTLTGRTGLFPANYVKFE